MASDKELTEMTVLEAWLRLCIETPEMIENYNRLRGTKLRFTLPKRSGIEMLVDQATGHTPDFGNDPQELQDFLDWCRDTLLRLPMLDDAKNFRRSDEIPQVMQERHKSAGDAEAGT